MSEHLLNESRVEIGPSVRAGWAIRAAVLALFAWSIWEYGLTPSHFVTLGLIALTPGPKLPKETYLEAGCLQVGKQSYEVLDCDYRLVGFDNIEVRHSGDVVVTIYKLGRGYREAIRHLGECGALDPTIEDKLTWRPRGL